MTGAGRIPPHIRRRVAQLCLAETEAEARRVLAEAFCEIGFDAVALTRRDGMGQASLVWREYHGGEPADDAATAPDDQPVLAKFEVGANRWIRSRCRSSADADGDLSQTEAIADDYILYNIFDKLNPTTIMIVTHRFDDHCLSMSVATREPLEKQAAHGKAIRLLSETYFDLRSRSLNNQVQPLSKRPRLKPKQLECLRWAAAGKTYHDIADIVGVSVRTVRFHLETVRDQYGYATITQTLVRAAKEHGLDPLDGR